MECHVLIFGPIRFSEIIIWLMHASSTFTTILVQQKFARYQPLCLEIRAAPNWHMQAAQKYTGCSKMY